MSTLRRLCAMFEPPKWALFTEVPTSPGFPANLRYCDAIAMGLWPSTRHIVHGFEFKASRTDWKRELDDPKKSAAFRRYCDRWWLVATDAAIVHDGELPDGWGMIVHRGDGLRIAVEAPALTPEPLGRPFVAALARSIWKIAPEVIAGRALNRKEIRESLRRARTQGYREGAELARSGLPLPADKDEASP